ncbi:MAG: hypothetical protein IJX97_05645 [Clostridia bacterium]|nr:hypothetical protein [Clostridia bacterium]
MMKDAKGIVDFHAHILPGADHGSGSLETTLWQLNAAKAVGVDRIVATPHFYPHKHSVDSFIERRNKAYDSLKKSIPAGVSIKLGAEVLICQGIERLPDIEKLFVEGTRTLLLELPFNMFDECYCESVKELCNMGVDVIIAHADRYTEEVIKKMLRSGARLQLNAGSLTRLFKRRCVVSWLRDGTVVALGSDIHGKDKKAYSDFARAVKYAGDRAEYIKKQSDVIWNK